MNWSCTVWWAIAIALCGITSVAYAGDCQEEYGKEVDKINAEFKEKMAQCHYPGNADCLAEAKKDKATGIKAAGKTRAECFTALTPKLDQSDPRIKWKKTFGLDPEKTVTLPDGTEEKIKNLALIEKNGKILGFPPSSYDSWGKQWELDRKSVNWQYIRGNKQQINAMGQYINRETGQRSEVKNGLWLKP